MSHVAQPGALDRALAGALAGGVAVLTAAVGAAAALAVFDDRAACFHAEPGALTWTAAAAGALAGALGWGRLFTGTWRLGLRSCAVVAFAAAATGGTATSPVALEAVAPACAGLLAAAVGGVGFLRPPPGGW